MKVPPIECPYVGCEVRCDNVFRFIDHVESSHRDDFYRLYGPPANAQSAYEGNVKE